MKNNMHPGEFLKDAYLVPQDINASDFAREIGVSSASISRLINGKSDMSVAMAIKLQKATGRSARSWLNLQLEYDLEKHGGA